MVTDKKLPAKRRWGHLRICSIGGQSTSIRFDGDLFHSHAQRSGHGTYTLTNAVYGTYTYFE